MRILVVQRKVRILARKRVYLRLNQEKKDYKEANWTCGREFVLDEEEHLEQNLLSAGAIGMDGENNQLKMLGCSRVIVIFISLAKM